MTILRRISTLLLLSCLTQVAAYAAPGAQIKQQLDSAWLLMGKTTTLKISLVTDADGQLIFQEKAYPPEVEVANPGNDSVVDLGNNRREILRNVIIQSFDSGMYTLPPVLFVRGTDTLRSNTLALKVVPTPVDTLQDIHDYASPIEQNLWWYDNLPDWLVDYGWWILCIIAGLMLLYWLYRRYGIKRVLAPLVKPERVEPPYEAAVRKLNTLREEHLCEQGRERDYYTRLTEILRVYIQDRFGINAMEMTSGQILRALQANEATRLSRPMMDEVLRMADFVKFAKARPLPEDNAAMFRRAMQFVEDTKPVVADENETSQPDNKSSKKE